MLDLNASTTRLDGVEGPSDADLAAEVAVEALPDTVEGWAALLDEVEPVVTLSNNDEDYWHEDDNVHDDRYDGNGVPSWSAWA